MPWSALAELSPARMDAGTPFGQAAHRSRRPRPSRNSMPLVINLSKGATFRLLNGLGHGGLGGWGGPLPPPPLQRTGRPGGVPPLRDVMPAAGNHHPRHSRHSVD